MDEIQGQFSDIPIFSESNNINSEIYDTILKEYNGVSKKDSILSEMPNDEETENSQYSYSIEKRENDEENQIIENVNLDKDEEEINFEKLQTEYQSNYKILDDEKYNVEINKELCISEKINQDINPSYQANCHYEKMKVEKEIYNNNNNNNNSKCSMLKNNSSKHFKNEVPNTFQDTFIKEMLIDIYKNTMEHKKTNFLCLEEILKKLTLILKRQNEINNFCISNKSDRQLLLQNMREIKKKIGDKGFNSLTNKDLGIYYIKNIKESEPKIINNLYKNKCLELDHKNEKYMNQNNKNMKEKTNDIYLFLIYLNQLEKYSWKFINFCRNASFQKYGDLTNIGNLQEKNIRSFLCDPKSMKLTIDLEKIVTKIKRNCS
ncbi:conserved Plasmodium protein, unknown function [Plasmodium berghei]|uniref:Uncharacterized protein n=3 Tax=Plasmodium berghei TaxID=5821 RepID=A0A509AM62_PLABA|nr:conserved Plasmodium protein, unknown function [Plasmodium berghei ANKA]CXI79270.1 conserved Plasmodium protein, unknown function [Plasmodium berghei]SCM25277.1 conserved Plasmodium protein, unknown function [Plasmodium berghei]SCN27319.1 conserved Plasmodium protein, unknown function [Plasmodium berghei]VUC57174.1 conserved Plasmodium protein, unknown function [Plasmodium berghei ANKA]|eukprot:XP_034422953.1 conserved Plasmodium protein, unknown function [Plasmodium berghei ANKA]